MVWDPFGDFESRGLLRNRYRIRDAAKLASAEYLIVQAKMPRALSILSRERDITLASWRRAHAVLFRDLYPWAGKLRHLDVERGPVRFNSYSRIAQDAEVVFTECAAEGFLEENLGYVYGELAFNHPFLDGKGRSLNTVFSGMCRRNQFDIAWDRVTKSDYLAHLTNAVTLREYDGLTSMLRSLKSPQKPLVRELTG